MVEDSTAENSDDEQAEDSLLTEAETTITVDSSNLAPEPTGKIKLLLEGTFHKDEVWQGVQQKKWLALVFEEGQYVLKPVQATVKTVYDPAHDPDSLHISGRAVSSSRPGTIVLLTGLSNPNPGKIDTVALERDVLAPGHKISFKTSRGTYQLTASGDSAAVEGTNLFKIQNYSWKVSGNKAGSKVTQTLAEDHSFENAIYVLLWMGDLDGDGVQDIIADLSTSRARNNITLFLSSMAGKGKLYHQAASFEFTSH